MPTYRHRFIYTLLTLGIIAMMTWQPILAQDAPPVRRLSGNATNIYAELMAPRDGGTVTGDVSLRGVASALDFSRYEIYLAPAGTLRGTLIAQSREPVSTLGRLGSWDSRTAPNGVYDFHLLVTRADETYVDSVVRQVTIANDVTPGQQPLPLSALPQVAPAPLLAAAAAGAPSGVTEPRTGDVVQGVVRIKGSAMHSDFLRYELYITPHGNESWSFLNMGSEQVSDGVLATWNTFAVYNGAYDLRLRVVRRDSNYDEFVTSNVMVQNEGGLAGPSSAVLNEVSGLISPPNSSTASGVVSIIGTALDTRFLRYELYYSPSGLPWWTWFSGGDAPVVRGPLGLWDTTRIPNGLYDLRLRVVRPDSNYSEYFTQNVLVQNGAAGDAPTPPASIPTPIGNAPTPPPAVATPTLLLSGFVSPQDGAEVSGVVTLRGTATDPHFARYEIYVTPAGSSEWMFVGMRDRQVVEGALFAWDTRGSNDGQYDVRLRVVRKDSNYNEYFIHNVNVRNGNAAQATPTPTATPTRAPRNEPTALPTPSLAGSGISAPQTNASVNGIVTVKGTANHPQYLRHELYTRPTGSNDAWAFVDMRYQPVYQGALAQWDTTRLAEGSYDLMLRVVRVDSNYDEYFMQGIRVRSGNATPVPPATPTPTAPPLVRATATPRPAATATAASGNSVTSPQANATVSGVVRVLGVANTSNFARYEVYVTAAGQDSWAFLSMGGNAIPAVGELTRWDTTTVPNGKYDLRLRVVKTDSNYDEVVVSNLTVDNRGGGSVATPTAVPATQTPAPPAPRPTSTRAAATDTPAPPDTPPTEPTATPVPPRDLRIQVVTPTEAQKINGTISVRGSASHPQFVRYELWVAKTTFPTAQEWILISTSNQPVVDGLLGAWNTWSVEDGLWDLRLRVVKDDSNYDETIVKRLQVKNR